MNNNEPKQLASHIGDKTMTHSKANTKITVKAIVIALIAMTFSFAAHAKDQTSAADVDFDLYQTYSWSTSGGTLSIAEQQIRAAAGL